MNNAFDLFRLPVPGYGERYDWDGTPYAPSVLMVAKLADIIRIKTITVFQRTNFEYVINTA